MKNEILTSVYIADAKRDIWSRPGYTGIAYSDGDEAEDRIAEVIDQASDITVLSAELRQHCIDWPSLYHLSGTRANILRPFDASLRGDILEIGSGCGAITRYLGESGANVLALEGSPRRAAITRSRTRDLENVTVLAEKLDQFQSNCQFDVVTLIGVLEYANLFMASENAALAMLQHVRTLLKPEGKLIIAIENQLGLKYFAGAPEDHLGQSMYGIEGRYAVDQPQTFGRAVLAGLLEKAGFAMAEFLAPFPDYKLPVSILTTEGLSSKRFDGAALAWQSVRRDPQLPPSTNFSLELTWPEIFKNGLALDMANSFLIVASLLQQQIVKPRILGYHYSTDRTPQFCKETIFTHTNKNTIVINYQMLGGHQYKDEINRIINFECPVGAAYVEGLPLSLEFVKIVTRDGWSIEEVGAFIQRYIDLLSQIADQKGNSIATSRLADKLSGDFFDIVPQNVIIAHNGRPAVIDTEWSLMGGIEFGFLLFRSLLLALGSGMNFGKNSAGQTFSRRMFIKSALDAAGYSLTEEDFLRFIELESVIQQEVSGRASQDSLNLWLEQMLPLSYVGARDKQSTNLNQILAERDEQIASLNQTIIETQREVNEVRHKLSEIRNTLSRVFSSRSWKITRPLRVLNGVVRWRQLSPDNFRILAVSLRSWGIAETISKIAARLRVMTAMDARVDEPWATTSATRSAIKLAQFYEPPADQIRKKVTLISMVRNEKSIIESFCAHALSLFDRIILVDHLSSDGTREYIKCLSEKHLSIEYLYFEEPGYYQSELMTWIARNIMDNETPGWVFFLDADEFLPFKSKEEFDRKLSEFRSFPVISMPWLNLIPLDMESGRVIDELFLKPPKPSSHCKVAFQPSLIPLDDYIVAQGNHALLMGDKFSQRLPVENAFPIYHLPIRTKQQLREKILHGVESYRRMGKDRATNLGFHWDEINRIIENSSLTTEMMAGIASRYGDSLNPPYERDINELREKGYSEMRMDVCFTQLMASFRDIKLALDDEIKGEPVSSPHTTNESEDFKKISLDPATHSLRFSR